MLVHTLSTLVIIGLSSSLRAGNLDVYPDYSTIQSAINATLAGDTISVQPESYVENDHSDIHELNGANLIPDTLKVAITKSSQINLKDIIDFVASLAVLAAAIVAIIGFNSWKKELKAKREYELAEEVLASFYEAKDIISYIRTPLSWGGEGESRKVNPAETPEQTRLLNLAYVTFERYQQNINLFSRISSYQYRFMFHFGPDSKTPFIELRKVLGELQSAARLLGTFWARREEIVQESGKSVKLSDDINKYESVIWEGKTPDLISKKIDKIVSNVEEILIKYIQK